jgi:predicted ATPase/DNA-binding SARP family transcriptional activator
MEFLILGPLEVLVDGHPVPVPAAKQRAVLAVLLLAGGSTVPSWRLAEQLWQEPPVSARKVVQTYVSKLRQLLPSGMLVTHQTGYALHAPPDDVDVRRFEHLLAEAGRAEPRREAGLLAEALALWRGPALLDFVDEPFARAHIARLEAMRLSAYERRLELDLADGRHESVLAEARSLVQANPFNERLRGQLMLALYRCDNQSEALEVYRAGRRTLVEQLGVEPAPALRRLEEAILRQDPGLDLVGAARGGVPRPAARAGSRPARRDGVPPPQAGRPRSAGSLVGRTKDLEQLRTLLHERQVRWVTLTGPAGVGKTRLAVEAAALLGQQYDDGWAFVDLARVTGAALVASEICSTIGVSVDSARTADDVLAQVLPTRKQLLVLDGFEHVAPAAKPAGALVAEAPGVTVIATSRVRLDAREEREYAVDTLDVPRADAPLPVVAAADAVVLFVERAREVRPDLALTASTAAQVAELCRHLDGLPLAIELAAARADVLSVRGLLARLDRRWELLATGSGRLPARQHSLHAAVDWSYRLLEPETRAGFCDLAVFTGGFTVDTAESVVRRGRLLDLVTSLRNASLLRAAGAPGDEPRFAMLETIREFGLSRLSESGRRDLVCSAHADAFARLAAEAEEQLRGPDQMRWLDLVQAELANIRQAVQWWVGRDDHEEALITLARLWRFWQVRGLAHEARARMEALLATPDLTDQARADGHLGVARCAFHQGDLAAVRIHVGRSLPQHRRSGDDFSTGFAMMLLGVTTGLTGAAERGTALLRQAVDLATASQESWLRACCLGYLGMVVSAQGRHAPARSALEEGLRAARELGDARLVGWFLVGLGRTALAAGDPRRARRRFAEALDWQHRLGDEWSEAWALHGAASAALAEQDDSAAGDLAVRSLRAARRSHNRPAAAAALRTLATLAARRSSPSVAAQLLGAASVVVGEERGLWAPDSDGIAGVDAAGLRESLGPAGFDDHWARGRAMTTQEWTALATGSISTANVGAAPTAATAPVMG